MDIENIRERVADVRERIPEVRERIDAWREDLELPSAQTAEAAAGAVLVGAGVVAAIVSLLGNKRDFWSWVLPSVLLSGGLALVLTSAFQRRGIRIEQAEAAVRAELDSLDPIARAKVLKEVAEDQLSRLGASSAGA